MPKILIVDDDVTISELMKTLVKMDGHEPTVVNDSMEAFDTAKEVKPDLITLDLMMPGLTGFDLCKMFHEDPGFSNIPVLIISAKDDAESKNTAIQLGAKKYIIKPFEIDEFINTIKNYTGG